MPKLKTRKSAAKRFKKTANGKYLHWRRGRRHIMQKKNAKRRRRLRHVAEVKKSEMSRIKASLPYGLD